jgi:hypothetical protein
VFNGVFEGEDSSLGLGLISDIRVLLSHSDHDTSVSGTSHDGGEVGSGSFISCLAGFAHGGSRISYTGLNFFLALFR